MLGIFKAKLKCDFTDGFGRIEDFLFGQFYYFQVNVFRRRFSRLLFNKVTKIIGRKVQLVGNVAYGWQAD